MADNEARIKITAVNATQQAFNEIKRSMADIEGSASSLRNSLLGIGAGLSIGSLVAFAKSGIDAADDLNKMSQKIGVSVESLSAFQYAAKLSNVSAEEFSHALGKLAKGAADAQAGTGDAGDAFKALGIKVANSSGQLKSTEELLLAVSEKFAGIEDGAGKTALAMRLFGRAGAELIPLLNNGRAGFEALRAEAERLGIVVSTKTAKAAEEFNDNLTRLGQGSNRLKVQLANDLLPILTKVVEQLLEGSRISGGFVESLRLFGTINPFRDLGRNITEYTEKVERLTKLVERNRARGLGTAGLAAEIEDQQKRIAFLKAQQRQEALALGGEDTPGERARMGITGKDAAPGIEDKDKKSKFDNAVKQLQEEALKVQDLSRTQEILAAIEQGRYGKLSQAQKNRLLDLATESDIQKQLAKDQKEVEEGTARNAEETEQRRRTESDRLFALMRAYKDMIDPLEQYRRKLAEIDELEKKGLLSSGEATEAKFKVELDIEDANEKLNGLKKETEDMAKDIGLIFSSAASDAIREWQGFGELIRSIGKDIAQYVLKKQVVDPLGKAASGVFDSALSGLFRADGGPVSGGSPYIVGERGPELFVPSSSGSIVPNHALGGGGVTIVQNIAFSGATPAAVRDAVNTMLPQISNAAVAAVRADRNRSGDAR